MIKVLLGASLQLFCVLAMATTISPFKHLGDLTHTADAIYLAKASDIIVDVDGDNTSYYQQFDIINTVKGNIQQTIPVRYHSTTQSGVYRSIAGEVEFDKGKTYLLFLRKTSGGDWVTACVSYYIFQEMIVDDQELLIPLYQKGLLNIADKKSKKEPLYNYNKEQLLKELKAVVKFEKPWEAKNAKAPTSYQRDTSKALKALPSHCNLFPVNPPPRWQNMDNDPLEVYYESSIAGCTSIGSKMNYIVNHMNSNYAGLNLDLAGSYNNYTPSCAGNSATKGNFTSFVDSHLGGQRSITVIFDDPCNQIPNLGGNNGCSGLLALGGLYFYTATQHNYNSETYSKAGYGYVIVNNGVGSCNCGLILPDNTETNFTLLMTHELTHSIGFFHMNGSVTNSNMAKTPCCSNAEITSLDVNCVNYVYNPLPNQGCTDSAAENYDSSATNNDGSCTYCSNNIQDGNETGIDCGGTGPGCSPCTPDLRILDCGSIIANATNLNVSGITVENIGNGTVGSSTVGYYLSTNTIINTNDYLIGTDPVSALGAGGTSNESFSVTLSALNIPNGTYYFGMIGDYNNIRNESNENNNRCYFPSPKITIASCDDGIMNGTETGVDCGGSCQACESDLIMDNCAVVSINSTTLTLTNAVIKNIGEGSSPASRVGYYLSTNPTITEEDILIGTDYVNSLAPGGSNTESFSIAISNLNLPFGIYYVGMIADYNQQVQEKSEINNTCYRTNPKLIISSCEDGIVSGDETGVDCGGSICDLCDCDTNKTYVGNINSDVTIHAPTWIRTSGSVTVAANADVNFIAGNNVLLRAGFEIKKGSKTVINTQNCN